MISIKGAPYRLCGGMTRRDALRIGAIGVGGFALSDLLRLQAAASPGKGRARNIVMVHLGGGPSHIDTYDPKPDAPSQVRGEFQAIPTRVDGIRIGELFPLQAAMMDRLAIIRSVYRGVDEHSSSHTVTGYSNMERRTQGERPSIGSVLAKVREDDTSLIPPYVSLRGVNPESGLGAGYLGPGYEPLYSDGPGRSDLKLRINARRMESRKRMLAQVDGFRHVIQSGAVSAQDAFSQKAMDVVSSTATYDALDLSKEDAKTRERYGKDHGNFLLARRLLEAGVRCVTLEVGGWDTHSGNFTQLRSIMPPLDKAVTALLTDLKDRGLYDETVFVMWGEFGRTPTINKDAGRDHWSRVMSAMVAGGGLKMGQVIGSTDTMGSDADDNPVHIREVVATLYHALGIDPHTNFLDGQQRPTPLIHDADPIAQLIG